MKMSIKSHPRATASLLAALAFTASAASAQTSLYTTDFGTAPSANGNFDVATAAGWSATSFTGTVATNITGTSGTAGSTLSVRVSNSTVLTGADLALVSTNNTNATNGRMDGYAFTNVTNFNLQDYSNLTFAWKGSSSAALVTFSAALKVDGLWYVASAQAPTNAVVTIGTFMTNKGTASYDMSSIISPSTSLFAFDPTSGSGSIALTATTLSSGTVSAIGFVFFNTGTVSGRIDDFSLTASAIPEPSTYAALAGLGMLGFAASRRRRSV